MWPRKKGNHLEKEAPKEAQVLRKKTRKQIIAELNDRFRQTFEGGKVVMTVGIANLRESTRYRIIEAIRTFDDFTPDNDPYGEHDFVNVEVDQERVFAKIDYYDLNLEFGSEDPADPEQTRRVLTIMLASEY